MKDNFFTLLLLVVAAFVGYKYWCKKSCGSCCSQQTTSQEAITVQAVQEAPALDGQIATPSIKSISTIAELDALLQQDRPAVLKVYADWCPPCKAASAVYPDIAAEIPYVDFYELNVDSAEVVQALSEKQIVDTPVSSIPTFLLIKNGKAIHTIQGFSGKDKFVEELKQFFSQDK